MRKILYVLIFCYKLDRGASVSPRCLFSVVGSETRSDGTVNAWDDCDCHL